MADYPPFTEALANGKKTEDYIGGWFIRSGCKVIDGPGNSDYDLEVWPPEKNIPLLLEIKDESNYTQSENLLIETAHGNPPRPSGMSVSKSTHHIHVFHNELIVYSTIAARDVLDNYNWWPPGTEIKATFGDYYGRGFTVPKVSLVTTLGYAQAQRIQQHHMLPSCPLFQ